MFYTTAWCTGNEQDFRKAIPLEMLGASMRRHGSTTPFTIVMLEGMEKLSAGYIRVLESLGFSLADHSADFRSIVADYPAIDRFYSRYERNCLLRWIALKQLSMRAGLSPFVPCHHLDSDVILHTSLDELAADTAGKTFMLQGCPVLVSIADPRWFDLYEENLKALNEDITGYSARALAQKEECLRQDPALANQSLYRNPIGSDQDLLEYLVSSGKIIQAPASAIFDSKYYFVQNPLAINIWHAAQDLPRGPEAYPPFSAAGLSEGHFPAAIGNSRFYADENSRIRIGAKQLPFTHFQNTFVRYAGVYLVTRQLYLPDLLARRILRYSIRNEQFHISLLYKLIAKINGRRSSLLHREDIMRTMMRPDKTPRLVALLNLLLDMRTDRSPERLPKRSKEHSTESGKQ